MTVRPEAQGASTRPAQGAAGALRAAAALALCAALLLAAAPARAQVPRWHPGGAQWQQRVQRWERLPRQRRQAILREQRRYRRLPPREQQRLFEQYRRGRR